MDLPVPAAVSRRAALASEITTLYAHINAATARLLELIAEFDAAGGYADDGALTTAHWLGWACGIGPAAAREKVRVARALERLPQIKAAFHAGTVSYSRVRALTRVATPACEATLLDMAGHATAGQTERIMRNYRQAMSLDGPAPDHVRREREFHCLWDDDGCLMIRGRLAPDQGALFLKALERAGAELAGRDASEAGESTWFDPALGSDYSADERRADALAALAERALVAEAGDGATADRFQVAVHVSAETLAAEGAPGYQPAGIEGGPAIGCERIRRLTCDGSIVPMLESAQGETLSVGRKTRTVPPSLRRALKRRDGGCRFPGCQNHRFVDAHHIQHWARGGETRLDNLVLLCRRHHRLLHEGGYAIRRLDDAGIQFIDPEGRVVPDAADDLTQGHWPTLVDEVDRALRGTGVSAGPPPLHARSLIPDLDWRPPDYQHIAWWMVNFMPR